MLVCSTANVVELLQSQRRVLADVHVQRLARDLAAPELPLAPAATSPSRGRAGRGVAYLVGALVALLVALTLIASPDVVRDAVEGAVDWVAGLFD